MNNLYLLFYFPKPRSHVRILIYGKWPIEPWFFRFSLNSFKEWDQSLSLIHHRSVKNAKQPVTVLPGYIIYVFLKVVYEAWETVFAGISKLQEEIWKCDMQHSIFDELWGEIWSNSILHVWYTYVLYHTRSSSSSQLLQCNMDIANVLFKSVGICIFKDQVQWSY